MLTLYNAITGFYKILMMTLDIIVIKGEIAQIWAISLFIKMIYNLLNQLCLITLQLSVLSATSFSLGWSKPKNKGNAGYTECFMNI